MLGANIAGEHLVKGRGELLRDLAITGGTIPGKIFVYTMLVEIFVEGCRVDGSKFCIGPCLL